MKSHRTQVTVIAFLAIVASGCGDRVPPRGADNDARRGPLVAESPTRPGILSAVSPEKVGRYVTAKAGARITFGADETYPLFEGRSYRLLFDAGGEYLVDYYGRDGRIPKASARRFEDAVLYYGQAGARDPGAAVAHVAVTNGDFLVAKSLFAVTAKFHQDDPSTLLGQWEASDPADRFGGLTDLGRMEKACDAAKTYEYAHALVSARLADLDRFVKNLRPDGARDGVEFSSNLSERIEYYLRERETLEKVVKKLKENYPEFNATAALEQRWRAFVDGLGGAVNIKRYVGWREEQRTKDREDRGRLHKERQTAYAAVRPEAISLTKELRGLVVREGAARQFLRKPEAADRLRSMTGPGNRTTAEEWAVIHKWTRTHRDRTWSVSDFDWRIVESQKGGPSGLRERDYPAILDNAITTIDAIHNRSADPEKGVSFEDRILIVRIRDLAAQELGYSAPPEGALSGVRKSPSWVLTLDTVVAEMEELVELLQSKPAPPKGKRAADADGDKKDKN